MRRRSSLLFRSAAFGAACGPFPALDRRWQVSQGGAVEPHWRNDRQTLEAGDPEFLFTPRAPFLAFAPAPDHSRFLAGVIPADARSEPIRASSTPRRFGRRTGEPCFQGTGNSQALPLVAPAARRPLRQRPSTLPGASSSPPDDDPPRSALLPAELDDRPTCVATAPTPTHAKARPTNGTRLVTITPAPPGRLRASGPPGYRRGVTPKPASATAQVQYLRVRYRVPPGCRPSIHG
jgi:hypothetical protein